MRTFTFVPAVLFVSLLAAGSLFAQATGAGNGVEGSPLEAVRTGSLEDVLRPGDQIRLRFWREPDHDGVYDIDVLGEAVLPFIGRTRVAFVPLHALRERLLGSFEERLVDQDVLIVFLKRIRVLGAVNQPGIYQVDETMALGDVLALAGGARPDGDLDGVRLIRGSSRVATLRSDPAPIAPSLRAGDEVFVPQQGWFRRNAAILVGTGASIAAAFVYRGIRN